MKKYAGIFTGNLVVMFLIVLLMSWSGTVKKEREYYQLTIYHYSTAAQEKILDQYLQQALLPALHRLNDDKSIGVFKAIGNDTAADKMLFVLVPFKSMKAISSLSEKLNSDKEYVAAGTEYHNASYSAPAYSRMETILLYAFSLAPQLQVPVLRATKNERVYELRSYESATEKIFKNKVHMFNEGGEIELFKKLNFNAAFYSEVIAGSKMPNLMYMTCFENKADRDEHWKKFGAHPDWKRLSALAEYQHNVSHIDITFLRPVDYSDY